MDNNNQNFAELYNELKQLLKDYHEAIDDDSLLQEKVNRSLTLLADALSDKDEAMKPARAKKLFDDMIRLAEEDGWDAQRMLEESPLMDEEREVTAAQYYELVKRLLKIKAKYFK